MTKPSWTFDKIGQITQSPEIIRESFRRMELPEILIREVIQNSLDARLPGKDLQMVFSFNKVQTNDIDAYLYTLIPRLKATRYGQPGKVISEEIMDSLEESTEISLMCLEDLGTTGLDGDTMLLDSETGSNFSSFWRAEGISSKQGTKGGRWGQGKTTLNMASKINTFWGLTVRASDSKELLMGKTLLSPHIINDERYMHQGLFINSDSTPISDSDYISNFKRNMCCLRSKHESGLSLIVPMPVPELSFESIVKAAIMHYFFPIMNENLTIKFKNYDQVFHDISNETLVDLSQSIDWTDTSWEKAKEIDNLEVLRFAQECVSIRHNGQMITLPEKIGSNRKITEEIIEESMNLGELMLRFNNGELLGFHVPVIISRKDGAQSPSSFEVYLKKYDNPSMVRSDEYYYRSGLSLPDERNRIGGLPVRGLLNAENDTISEFLGDAEEPAHTKWNNLNEEFLRKYSEPKKTLAFIRNSMRALTRILNIHTRERDYDLLDHIFSLPEDSPSNPTHDTSSGATKGTQQSDDPPGKIPGTNPPLSVSKIRGGLVVRYDGNRTKLPITARMKLAYDVPRGNPFSSYEMFDFDLTNGDLRISQNTCKILSTRLNTIVFSIENKDQYLQITGFDENRDLITNIVLVTD